MRRRPERRDPVSTAGSLAVHGVALFVAWWSATATPPEAQYVTYKIDLVSPPPAVQAKEQTEAQKKLVVERPEPQPEPEKKAPPPVTQPEKKKPTSANEKPAPPSKPTAKAAKTEKKATTTEAPKEKKSSESGEGIRVKMEGLRRDYPAYYNNIIVQMARCFRWDQGGNWSTVIDFVIRKSGKVTNIKVAQPSGNPVFDIQAMGAAECAGQGRLDSLPKDLPYDRLPVRFRITPSGGGGGPPSAEEEPENR